MGFLNKISARLRILTGKNKSIHPEVLLGKGVPKIWRKFTGEQPYQSTIAKQLY